MTLSTPRSLTRLKLETLRARRDELRLIYAEIERLADVDLPGAFARLAALKSGKETLHPEAGLVADVLGVDPEGRLTAAHADLRRRLAGELDAGRARAEYAWIFAELVDEWAAAHAGEQTRAVVGEPVTGTDLPVDLDAVAAAFGDDAERWDALAHELTEYDGRHARDPVYANEVTQALELIGGSPYRTEALRGEARLVRVNETLVGEYAGALTIFIDEPARWAWPAAGVPVRRVNAEGKVRRYLDESLLDALFLEILADRWADQIAGAFKNEIWDPIITDWTVRTVIDRSAGATMFEASTRADDASSYTRADAVFDKRDGLGRWLAAIHEQLHAQRALDQAQPITVLVTDIVAFGPSLSHEVIARVLARVGLPERWRAVVERFLAVPVSSGGVVEICRRGIFPDQRLGMLLAELVLSVVALAVRERTGITPVRLVDDIALVGPPDQVRAAWLVLVGVLGAFGLEASAAKTVATTIGGDHPADLPAGPVKAGYLVLRADGSWGYDHDAIAAAHRAALAAAEGAASVFDAVNVFSDRVRDLARRLNLFAPLGAAHIAEIGKRMGALYADFAPLLEARIARAVPAGEPHQVPRSVWYWPRTAGGFGLYDVAAQLAPLHSSWRTMPPSPVVPRLRDDSEAVVSEWRAFVGAIGNEPRPRQPEYTIELGRADR